jgi:membrane protein YqaA with SNARE-associated domain
MIQQQNLSEENKNAIVVGIAIAAATSLLGALITWGIDEAKKAIEAKRAKATGGAR